jgi:predicted nuclease of restriction endonuclease-like RecB superfamily
VASARQSVISRKNMLERFRDKPAKEIIYTKIQHRRQQQHELENQLEDCVKQAKYLYLRGLNNETQRISSAAPARSSR